MLPEPSMDEPVPVQPEQLRSRWRELRLAMSVPFLLLIAGTAGYVLIEGWSWFDALYMTVITLATIGFGEVHPMSPAGRAFTIVLTLGGVFTIIYAATAVIRSIVSGELSHVFGRQRMDKRLAALRDHVIVCGFGRMGRLVCTELDSQAVPFVVIELVAARLESFGFRHGLPLPGDASLDELLRRAGIERARALVTVVASDADNLYICMSARLLNEKLTVVARAEDEHSEKKFIRAGATRVVSPYVIGGHRVAHAVIRPAVVEFIELATGAQSLELSMEETRIDRGSRLAGGAYSATELVHDRGLILVAVKRAAGEMIFNPELATPLAPGDTLITLGRPEAQARLGALARA